MTKAAAVKFGALGLITAVAAIGFVATLPDPPPPRPSEPRPVLNIIVCLDLSDRICRELNPGQWERDQATIRAILDVFQGIVADQGLYLLAEHRLVITVIPQPVRYEPLLRELADVLRLDAAKLQSGGKPAFDAARTEVEAAVSKLYAAAVESESDSFAGADVWGFTRDYLPLLEMPPRADRPVRNIAIFLSDGYIALEKHVQGGRPPKTYLTAADIAALRAAGDGGGKRPGLAPVPGLDLSAWEVLVLEVHLHQIRDRNILERVWCEDWLTKMGARNCRLVVRQDSKALTREVVDHSLRERSHEAPARESTRP